MTTNRMFYEVPEKKPPPAKKQCRTEGCTNMVSVQAAYLHCKKCRAVIRAQEKVEAAQRILERLAAA